MRKFFEIGGLVAAVVLIAFGVVTIVMGVNGRNTVASSLKTEQITGSPDMTPAAITAEAQKAELDWHRSRLPTCSVANEPINTGDRARGFALYMQIHALEATGGVPLLADGRASRPRQDGKGTEQGAQQIRRRSGRPSTTAPATSG